MSIIGMDITEEEYRALDFPSYSLLSNIKKAGSAAVNAERLDISDYDGIVIGSLVDSIITNGAIPTNLIVLPKKPAGKPLEIIKAISTRNDLVDNINLLSTKNNAIIEEELNSFKYYPGSTFAVRRSKLLKYKNYAAALVKDPSSMIVSDYQLNEAKTLSRNLILKYPFIYNNPNIQYQIKVCGLIEDIPIKGMLDFVHIDHIEKTITPYDLKTGFGPHYDFFENSFLGWNYYLQASLYKNLLETEISVSNPEYKDYRIEDFRFMYCGRADKLPIVYQVTKNWHDAGFTGFDYKGVSYPGLIELINDFVFYKANPNQQYKRGYETPVVLFDDKVL